MQISVVGLPGVLSRFCCEPPLQLLNLSKSNHLVEFLEGRAVGKNTRGRALSLDLCQRRTDRFGGDQQRANRKDNDAITELLQLLQRHQWSIPASRPVEEQENI